MRTGFRHASALAVTVVALLGTTLDTAVAQQRRQVPDNRESVRLSFAPIVKQVVPAVVNVYVRGRVAVRSPFDDPVMRQLFGDRFGMPQERIQNSLGSGVIVSRDGIVVTNTHVVKIGAQSEIRIVLHDKREFDAKVILQDERADIAVLRIEGGDGNFPFLDFSDSDDVEVGDMVLAIGNPFGVGQSVSQGIVSALGRSLSAKSSAPAFIQTDAAVNPGNSGGALVDLGGKLIGINTAILSRSGASHGIGFAVPANLVRVFVNSAITGKKIERPWLGIRPESVTRDIARDMGLSRAAGVLVSRVTAGSPAAAARIAPGDIITAIDGQPIADAQELDYRMTTRGVGQTVRLTLNRQGRETTVDVVLKAAPALQEGDVRNITGQNPLQGARIGTMSPLVAQELGLEEETGVVIIQVVRGTLAERLGFQRGDIITHFDGAPVESAASFEEQLRARETERRQQLAQRQRLTPWQLTVKRNGQEQQLLQR